MQPTLTKRADTTSFPPNPLPTDFDPPANCSGLYHSKAFMFDDKHSCLPSGFDPDPTRFFSPGVVCPTGYTAKSPCSRSDGVGSITTVTCCPVRGDITLSCVDDDPVTLTNVSSTLFCTWSAGPRTELLATVTNTGGALSTKVITLEGTMGIDALGIRMLHQSTDVASTVPVQTSPGSPNSQQEGPDEGLSTGSKIAIGIAIPLAALAFLGALFAWRRRQRRYLSRAVKAEEPGPLGSTSDDAKRGASAGTSLRLEDASNSSIAVFRKREKYGLFRLYSKLASTDFDVDIIAIHGLGGDWEETWTDAGKLWLRDFLPTQFPKIRVWSFGYKSDVLTKSIEDIHDAAISLVDSLNGERQSTASKTKPIIFVAHSLGGIIVKKALILANERSDYWKDIQESTIGVLFFGVPHNGADKAFWAKCAANMLAFTSLGFVGNPSFAQVLKRNSPELSKVSSAFIQPASKIKTIRSFYETEKIGNDIIVDRDSASLRVTNEVVVPIQGADHRDMCRLASSESQKYRPVHNALESMISELSAKPTEDENGTVGAAG